MSRGINLVISVVLPEPLQPARPIIRMAPYSKTPGFEAGRYAAAQVRGYSAGCARAPFGVPQLLFQPQSVMLFCPVDVHAALAHRLKGTFHPDRADVDVSEHGSDEQHRDNRMDNLGDLHPLDSRRIEGEQEEITGRRGSAAADHDDPINHLLAGVEPIRGRMIVSDNATTTLDPFNINAVGNIAADPHEENQ